MSNDDLYPYGDVNKVGNLNKLMVNNEQWTYPKDFFKQRKRWMQGIYMVCRLFFFRICSRIFLVWSTARENIDQSEDVRSFQIKAHSDEIQVHPLNFSGWAPATATLLPSSSTSWK